jgi:histidine triad (HIT) family protein
MDNCLFCKVIKGDIPAKKLFEDDQMVAIQDINPQAPTHLLILPRKHLATVLDISAADHLLMGRAIAVGNTLAKERGLDKSGFRLVVNCGAGAGQTVFHLHFHLLGGRAMEWPPG